MKKQMNETEQSISALGPPDCIDPTMGSAMDECPRRFYWRHIRGVTPLTEPDYFVSGRAWDAALGEWFNPKEPNEKARFKAAAQAMQRTYDTSRCAYFHPKRTVENLFALFSKYVLEMGDVQFKVLDSNVGFKLPYKDFWLGGEIDRYTEWPHYGVVVEEEKTTLNYPEKKGWDNYVEGFKLGRYANQIKHYTWAVMQITGEIWGVRVHISSLDIPARSTTKRTLFEQVWIKFTDDELLDYLSLCEQRMERILRCWETWTWPKAGHHCTGGWGFSKCEYAPLCRMKAPLHLIEVPFNEYLEGEPWRPWDGVKGKEDER